MRLTGHHALGGLASVAEHLFGKPAQSNLLGSGPRVRVFMFRLLDVTLRQARAHNWGAVRSRISDESSTRYRVA
ncbi:acyl-CoA synthetase [Mycobacterium liflandii]|nr:acyl-CoA synthetase [Mycobacterium liflandii]